MNVPQSRLMMNEVLRHILGTLAEFSRGEAALGDRETVRFHVQRLWAGDPGGVGRVCLSPSPKAPRPRSIDGWEKDV